MSEERDVDGLRPLYHTYKQQKCFVAHSFEAPWCVDIMDACWEVLPEFGLDPWDATHNFDPTRPLRDKVVEMIANARYGIYDLSYWIRTDKERKPVRDENGKVIWEMPRNVLIELGMAIALNRPALMLRNTKNREAGLNLPRYLESASEQILEFSGEYTLKKVLQERLPQWVNTPPDRNWWNRHCLFGGRECKYREAHPHQIRFSRGKLPLHISDGTDSDRPDFREVLRDILRRRSDIEYNYLDDLNIPTGYNFLLCTCCQNVRSTPFAIYRITPDTASETFIAIGMSIALEKQFEYKIPKILLTASKQDIPSLLDGYEVVIAQNSQETKNLLREFVPDVIRKVRETTWRPRPLPFEMIMPKPHDMDIPVPDAPQAQTTPTESPIDAMAEALPDIADVPLDDRAEALPDIADISPVALPESGAAGPVANGVPESQQIEIEDLGDMEPEPARLAPPSPEALAEAYNAVREGKITDPDTIRELANRFEALAKDPVAYSTVPYDAERAAQVLRQRAEYIEQAGVREAASSTFVQPAAEEEPYDFENDLETSRRIREAASRLTEQPIAEEEQYDLSEDYEVAKRIREAASFFPEEPAVVREQPEQSSEKAASRPRTPSRNTEEQIIYLGAEDELTIVRERLEMTTARKIVIVVPTQTQLRSHVGWRLLHARARELGKDVLVISPDRQIRAVARAAGFAVAETYEAAPRSTSRRPRKNPS